MNDKIIEQIYAEKYNTTITSRKDIGDIYVDEVPINIKSSHVDRNNYSPNLVSADKLFNHFNNPNNNLKFMFVKYDDNNVIEEKLVNAEYKAHTFCPRVAASWLYKLNIFSDLRSGMMLSSISLTLEAISRCSAHF